MPLLSVNNLSVSFHTRNGVTEAVKDVSFSLSKGETLGIVGESGSGKSVSCYSIMGLIPQPPGRIESGQAMLDNIDLLKCNEKTQLDIRGNKVAMIFQDPMTCLNPYIRVGEQLIEPLTYHKNVSRIVAKQRAIELLKEVGIRDPEANFDAWPHEFSGGMRQRVMIAMALIAEPELLIADEPTTALDVTIQKQILELVADIQKRRNIAVIFISHDLAVVKGLADRIMVMKSGEIVEEGETNTVFNNPQHEYTKKLIAAIPTGAKKASQVVDKSLVQVDNLVVEFATDQGRFRAIDEVSFDVKKGEILGLVGESGSGKSTIGRSLLQLVSASGKATFDGISLLDKSAKEFLPLRRRMQMIFQDPYASLNPRMNVFDTLAEPLKVHGIASGEGLVEAVFALMDDVGLDRKFARKYPHEFSGGQRQRIAIGRAIATKPDFIVADEPVSALDVTIQKQILELIESLVKKHNLSMLFISHDLAVVRRICDRVIVLKHGVLVERGHVNEVWSSPQHQYTQSLLNATPDAIA